MAKAKIKILIFVGLGIGVACTSTTLAYAQGRASFPIFVPRKVNLGTKPTNAQFLQIGLAKAFVSVTSAGPVVFTITGPNGAQQSFSALTPGGNLQTLIFGGDTVTAVSNTDPANPNRYEIDFILRSNSAIDCTGTQSQPQSTYTVSVRATDPQITRVCLDSYDGRYRSVPINTCTNAALGANLIPIPLDDPADKVASLDPVRQPTERCASFINPNPPNGLRVAPQRILLPRRPF
jgi:hypothetical protein